MKAVFDLVANLVSGHTHFSQEYIIKNKTSNCTSAVLCLSVACYSCFMQYTVLLQWILNKHENANFTIHTLALLSQTVLLCNVSSCSLILICIHYVNFVICIQTQDIVFLYNILDLLWYYIHSNCRIFVKTGNENCHLSTEHKQQYFIIDIL